MKFKPYKYQSFAINKIISQNKVGLFLDMGLGKTVITLTALNELMYNHFAIRKALVVAPLRVAETTWTDEKNKWEHLKHLKTVQILGPAKNRIEALKQEGDIYIINRENIPWLCDYIKSGNSTWDFDALIIDELSSFKSPSAQRFKKLRKYAEQTERVIGLTGTPSPNGLIDLWAEIFLLDCGERLQKRYTWFRELYFEPDRRSRERVFSYKPKVGAKEKIFQRLSDLCVSMSAEDYLELPERTDRVTELIFPQNLMKKYEKFERDSYLKVSESESGITAWSAAGLINKLLQFSNGAVYDENGDFHKVHDIKLEALSEIAECGQPVLCFYSYKSDLMRIKEKFPHARTLEGPEDIKEWNSGEIDLLLCHPASAGHGLNLQSGGHIIVWFGLPWSLEQYQQANARLHRQGQKEKVTIHHLICKGTADEKVYSALQGKTDIQEAVLINLKAKIGEKE